MHEARPDTTTHFQSTAPSAMSPAAEAATLETASLEGDAPFAATTAAQAATPHTESSAPRHAARPRVRSAEALDVLIVSPAEAAVPLADELRRQLDCAVAVAESRRAALVLLRRQEFALVLIEESLTARDVESAELLYAAAQSASLLELALAVQGTPRVVRQVRAALHRRAQEQARARKAAALRLQGELKASLTGLLLESQLALRAATPAQHPRLEHLVELANDLRRRLQTPV